MDGELFGWTAGGEAVHRIRIEGGGLKASVLTFGAVLQDLRLDGHDAPLVLGFERFEDYARHVLYMGAVVGRYANRIRDGRFTLDGERHQTDRNDGRHTLHGGANGYSQRNWQVALHGADFVTLSLHDPAGEMGFPGAVEVTCTYRLKIPGTLSVEIGAVTDAATVCCPVHHSYFNLDDGGSGDILDHRLSILASAYLPIDAEFIPTGEVRPVDGTPFDFRQARDIRTPGGKQVLYDHNFCLAAAHGPLRQAAWAQGPESGVEMEVWTTEPGLQLYVGQQVGREAQGHGGRRYRDFAGFCLEPQVWPDSPNRSYFPQAVLRPGETYHQVSEYRFRLP